MDPFLAGYLGSWLAACAAAAAYAFARRDALRRRYAGYLRFLGARWKVATFAIAAGAMAVVAPWTGDPTWDWFDALFMSALTFATAPWALGVLYLALRGRAPVAHAGLASCAWMFSASWSYDLYILLRDGFYPVAWAENIAASSVLYASAGFLWSLEHVPGRGVVFGFMREDWPAPLAPAPFGRIAWAAFPFMAFAAAAVAYFVGTHLAVR